MSMYVVYALIVFVAFVGLTVIFATNLSGMAVKNIPKD